MNIRTAELRHRMIRLGRHKLCWYDGHPPQLFDLRADPDELEDRALSRPDITADLSAMAQTGWNPDDIARQQQRSRERTRLIRDWVRQNRPDEPFRWKDPHPERNGYL